MPQFKVTGPDGKSYRVNAPEGASQDDAIAYIANTHYGAPAARAPEIEVPQAPEEPKEELGFFGALKRGFTTLGDVPEALGFATGQEGAREELVKAQQGEEKRAEGFGLDKTLGENVQALKELAGESLGFMAAPLAAGVAGSAVGTPIVGAGAAAATLLSQYGVQNLARQAQEDKAREERGEAPLGPMPGRAAAAAVGQAGLDVAGFALPILRPVAAAFPFLRPLVGLGGKKAAAETAEAIVEAAAKKQLTIKGGIARGVAQGVAFEIPQETAQTVLERWQAKLPLDDDSAIEEYKQAAIGAAVLGGGFGAVGGGINAARDQASGAKEAKALEAAAGLELSTPEEKAEFERLLSAAVNEYANANRSTAPADIFKALRDDGTIRSLGNRAKANVEATQTQAEAGAGLDGGAGRPDVDVTGAAGASVPPAGNAAPTGEDTQTVPQAEPIGVAGAGEPAGGVAGAEAGADGTLTPDEGPAPGFVRVYHGGQPLGPGETGRMFTTSRQYAEGHASEFPAGTAEVLYTDLSENDPRVTPEYPEQGPKQGFTFNPQLTADEMKGVRSLGFPTPAPETQAAEERYAGLEDAYAADTSVKKQRAIAPVVANIFSQTTGLEGFNSPKIKALPENIQKAYNTTVAAVLNGVKRGETINPETIAQQKMTEYGVTLPEAVAPEAAPEAAPTETAAPEAAPAETAAPEPELTAEGVMAKIKGALDARVLTPKMADVMYDKVQTGEMELPEIAAYVDDATAEGYNNLLAAGKPTREAAPAAREAEADPIAPARGKMRMAERVSQLVPIIDSATTDLADIYELPAGPAGVQARNDAIRAAATQIGQTLGQDVTSKKTSKINLDRIVAKVMAEKGFKKKAKAKSAPATSTSGVQPGGLIAGVRMDIDKYRGGTLSDLLEEIFANFDGKFSQYDMYLAGRISTLLNEAERAGLKVKLNILQKEGEIAPTNVARGIAYGAVSTDLTNNTIDVYLRSPTMGENSAGNTSEVVLHEALHAVSKAFILAVRKTNRATPNIVKFVNDLNGVRNAFVAHFNARVRSGAELSEFEQSILKKSSNAFADLDEFLTWGMTNANAQEYLRGIDVGPGQNLFQRFVAMFKSMLGIPDGDTSALSRLIEIVNPLFEATEADYKAVMGTPVTGTAEARAKAKKPPQPQKPRVIKINQAKLKWAMREAGLLRRRDNAFRKKLIQSKNTHQLSDSVGDMFFGSRAYQGPMNLLRALRDSLTPQAKKAMLPFLPTDDITRWVGDRLKNVAVVNKLIDDMTVYRNKRLEKTSVIQNKWMKFMTAFPKGSDILNVLTKLADYHDVDPTLAATADEYAKIDAEMKLLIKEKASEAKRKARLEAIDEVYAAKRELMRRENGSGAGLEIFKLAKDAYRRNLIDSYILTLNRISGAGLSAEAEKIAVSSIKYMYKEALARRVYFPTMRYGRFWMSVGSGKNVEYYMFESAFERDMAFAQRKRDMAKENDLRDMKKGNNYKEVTDYLTKGNDASAALKEVFTQLDSGNAENTAQLKDTVFQMYLLALPEGDMRKRFSHRRYVTGFGTDALRDFSNSQSRAASQLARLSYAHQVRTELATLEKDAKEREDFVDLEPFFEEISERAKAEIDPPVRGGFYGLLDKFAGLGNKFVFLWMLTSPKSALIQATQLHTVGLPVLSDEFGFRKVMDIAGRYSMDIILGNKLAIHRKDNNGDIISEFNINMRDAKFMQDLAKSDPQKHKLLLEAYDYADQRGTFASTFISDLNETASRPTKVGTVKSALKEGDVLSAAKQGGDAMMQFMSAGFHQMENMNRQIMYMTSFELAYEQAKKSGMSDAAAKEKAMERALKVTRETMFNYSNYNKPRAFKNPAGRVAFQFMTYPVMMTSYLLRNAKNMLPVIGSPEGKMSAAKRLFGTLGMTAMYAGLTGLPLYGVIMMAAEAGREMMRDDDDFAPYEDDKGNPVGKVDLKFWFENSWLPETFGPDSSVADALGLSPELAALLERSVKFGPISALSDMNLAASTSLNSLFFRGDIKADNLEGQFKEILYNQMMGPLGGLISNMTRGVQLYEEGETTRAMELMLPAFVKGAVRASRLESEGLKTIDGKVLKDADFYTEGKLFSQVLGFGSTETYEMQKQNFEGKQLVDEIKAERQNIIQKVKNAELRNLDKPTEANLRAVDRAYRELEVFDNKFPLSPVGGDTIGTAISNTLEEQAGSIGGSEIEPEYPVMADIQERRIKRGE